MPLYVTANIAYVTSWGDTLGARLLYILYVTKVDAPW